jgi:hypothetical protein
MFLDKEASWQKGRAPKTIPSDPQLKTDTHAQTVKKKIRGLSYKTFYLVTFITFTLV